MQRQRARCRKSPPRLARGGTAPFSCRPSRRWCAPQKGQCPTVRVGVTLSGRTRRAVNHRQQTEKNGDIHGQLTDLSSTNAAEMAGNDPSLHRRARAYDTECTGVRQELIDVRQHAPALRAAFSPTRGSCSAIWPTKTLANHELWRQSWHRPRTIDRTSAVVRRCGACSFGRRLRR